MIKRMDLSLDERKGKIKPIVIKGRANKKNIKDLQVKQKYVEKVFWK